MISTHEKGIWEGLNQVRSVKRIHLLDKFQVYVCGRCPNEIKSGTNALPELVCQCFDISKNSNIFGDLHTNGIT